MDETCIAVILAALFDVILAAVLCRYFCCNPGRSFFSSDKKYWLMTQNSLSRLVPNTSRRHNFSNVESHDGRTRLGCQICMVSLSFEYWICISSAAMPHARILCNEKDRSAVKKWWPPWRECLEIWPTVDTCSCHGTRLTCRCRSAFRTVNYRKIKASGLVVEFLRWFWKNEVDHYDTVRFLLSSQAGEGD